MDSICRLCHSTAFVSNNIFDEETALHIKMSLCLPVKILKNDGLPQKICDKCSCRVNDFYQYCNEVIEVQNRLKSSIDEITITEHNVKPSKSPVPQTQLDKQTQTGTENLLDESKIKKECLNEYTDTEYQVQKYEDEVKYNYSSDGSEDMSLLKVRELKNQNGVKSEIDINEVLNKLSRSCDLVVKNIEDMNEDEKKIESYVCCICDYFCLQRIDINKHYRTHRVNTGKPPQPPSFPTDSDSIKCNRCHIKLMCEKTWYRHWTNHWKRDNCPYTCTKCHKGFLDINAIVKHGIKHQLENNEKDLEKVFVCDICPESFAHMRTLSSHRTRAHPESQNRPLNPRCGICGRTFTHSTSLQRHSRVHHSQRDSFLCTVCGKTLSSKEHLKFHMHIHLQYKPNVCKTCGKAFVKKCNLTLHERVHSGERPHVCTHCGKAFSQRSTLVIHERYHSGARPYVCNLCGRGFVAKGLLSMHAKNTCI